MFDVMSNIHGYGLFHTHDGVIEFSALLESTGHRWIPLTKASDVDLLYFLWTAPEQTTEQTMEMPGIWDAIALIMTPL